MAEFDLSGAMPMQQGFSLEEEQDVQPMDIGASLPVALLPAGFGTVPQEPTYIRSGRVGITASTTTQQVARANARLVDGIDEVSPRTRARYELFHALSGMKGKGNHGYFVQTGGPPQSSSVEQNDSILQEVRAYGGLQERTAAFVAGLEQLDQGASSSSAYTSLNSMTREEVLVGLKDGVITYDASAEQAFLQAAASTRAQFVKQFPDSMTYPTALETWMLAMGRTPSTRTPFARLTLSFLNETLMADPSVSVTTSALDANLVLASGAAQALITDPVRSQVFENLGAVSGAPSRIRKLKPRLLDLDLLSW